MRTRTPPPMMESLARVRREHQDACGGVANWGLCGGHAIICRSLPEYSTLSEIQG